MHIKALLVLLPLLLNPASSLAIPPAEGQGSRLMYDPSASSDGEPYDGKIPIPPPFHRGQRNRIENHVKPIKSEKIQGDFGIGSQSGPRKHTLNARMPPKKTNKNNPPDNSKKENAPANNKKPADDTQTSGEPSGTQPQGPSGGTRSQTKKAEAERAKAQQNPSEESKKTQGESSGTPPESQPGSAEQKPQGKESNSGGRQMTLPVHPKPNTKDETKDNTKQNQPAQAPDQPGDKKDGAEKKDGKGDGEPAGNDDPEKKKADKALEEAKKKEEEEKKYAGTMYHAVTPDPNKYRGLERLDGQREYMRKIGDGNPNASGRYGTHSPSVSGVQSHNQEPGISEQKAKDNGKPETARKRPGEREERVTTGHERVNEKGESLTEWHKISPKKQEQLPKGTTPWTDEDLRKNLIEQQKEFPNHKSEVKDDKYGKLTQKMLDMCNHEQCTKQEFENNLKRSIAEQPLLRRRMESLLEERDHIMRMAMR